MTNNRYKIHFENLVSSKLLLFVEYYFSITFPIFSSDIFVCLSFRKEAELYTTYKINYRCISLRKTCLLKQVPILAPKPVLRTQLEEAEVKIMITLERCKRKEPEACCKIIHVTEFVF